MYTFVECQNSQVLSGPQLAAAKFSMTAVPSGMVKSMARGRSGKAAGRPVKLGKTVARFYNEIGSRPVPRNGISLTQSITLELTVTGSAFTTSNIGAFSGSAFATALSNFSASSVLAAVFDQYKFEQLEFWLEPVAPMGTTAFGVVTSAVDLDDATPPSSQSAVQDHPGALQGTGGAGHYHKFKPHMAVAVYSGAFTSFANEPANWIDIASPNVQHYGLKFCSTGFSAAIGYNQTIRAVISFRGSVIN